MPEKKQEEVLHIGNVLCQVKRRRGTRRVRLAIGRDGSVVLTLPCAVSLSRGQQFLESKREWIVAMKERQEAHPKRLLDQGSDEEYRLTKEAARLCITERVTCYQALYGVEYRSLSIRNQKTRFGSCSSRGQLSFNYRLIYLPEHLRDYVVVHELCHLRELNHSPRFWALVAQTIPDYQIQKRRLQGFSRPL
jgi:predicted metal-dependent hydrolase